MNKMQEKVKNCLKKQTYGHLTNFYTAQKIRAIIRKVVSKIIAFKK